MASDDASGGVKAAAVIRPQGAGVTDCLEGFTRILQGQGYVVRGLIQRNGSEDSPCGCTMMLVDIDTSEHYQISQNLGPESTCCHVDTSGFAEASQVLRRAMAMDTDLIVVNKFGKLEAQGLGLADEMMAIMAQGIPLITTVETPSLDIWREFTGGLADELPANCGGLMRWWENIRPRGLPRAFRDAPRSLAPCDRKSQDAFQRIEPIPEMS